ncbi:MAG: orotidine-5'-phosphate decarboxylase [Deltaproteobacteria bacterium]|nr:orotidine-5'-phosphate decarboxylase [Deltaproteobacteria bacterium]
MPQSSDPHFADRLISRVRELGHPLCLGLDPHLAQIPALFRRGDMSAASQQTLEGVGDFLFAILERAEGRAAVVKPQIAFFEQLGWRGLELLTRVVDRARALGFLVLLDAKRGDIGSTADGYARAYLEPGSPIEVDAITLNPYLGLDSLEPFSARAEAHGRGLFVLVKTSNPGSGDLQDLDLPGSEASSKELSKVFCAVARSLAPLSQKLVGKQTGWSSLGTYPAEAQVVREALPNSLFLVPGYGAQGGSAAAAVSGFVPGPRGLEGGLVNSSRGILFPEAGKVAESSAWERAIDSALDRAIAELGEAVTRGTG